MRARVRSNYRFQTVKAAGQEWVKEWRPVSPEAEAAILADDRLETDKAAEIVVKPKPAGKVKHL